MGTEECVVAGASRFFARAGSHLPSVLHVAVHHLLVVIAGLI